MRLLGGVDAASALFFAPSGSGGVCPTGGAHIFDGDIFATPLDKGDPRQQSGWNMCRNCSTLFLGTNAGLCPATKSAHVEQSAVVAHGLINHFAVPLGNSGFLPHGRGCFPGAVDLKINPFDCRLVYSL